MFLAGSYNTVCNVELQLMTHIISTNYYHEKTTIKIYDVFYNVFYNSWT